MLLVGQLEEHLGYKPESELLQTDHMFILMHLSGSNQTAQVYVVVVLGMHLYEFIAPLIANSLQSDQF